MIRWVKGRADVRLLVGGVALVVLATGLLVLPDEDDQRATGRLTVALEAPLRLLPTETGLRSLDVPLTARQQTVRASTFSMVAVTWRDDSRHDVRVRTRSGERWTSWRDLEPLDDGPNRGAEGAGVSGTDLRWVGRSDAVQVDVSGERPAGLSLVLLDPQRTAADRAPASVERRRPSRKPPTHSRREWGADPRLHTGRPTYNRTLQQVHLHHTVNSNGYARDDVPGLLRGIYRYHTRNLGWSDIGYNFLVDRFGRIWTGRDGGVWKSVRGAHTLGFNNTSTGIAVIGNYQHRRPGSRVLTAIVRLAAWKLYRAGRDPAGRVGVYSHGSDRYRGGRTVWLPVIDGHRDTNETACPGAQLYRQLPGIRRRTAALVARF